MRYISFKLDDWRVFFSPFVFFVFILLYQFILYPNFFFLLFLHHNCREEAPPSSSTTSSFPHQHIWTPQHKKQSYTNKNHRSKSSHKNQRYPEIQNMISQPIKIKGAKTKTGSSMTQAHVSITASIHTRCRAYFQATTTVAPLLPHSRHQRLHLSLSISANALFLSSLLRQRKHWCWPKQCCGDVCVFLLLQIWENDFFCFWFEKGTSLLSDLREGDSLSFPSSLWCLRCWVLCCCCPTYFPLILLSCLLWWCRRRLLLVGQHDILVLVGGIDEDTGTKWQKDQEKK